jgi:CRISPR-associated protein Cas5d
MVFLLVNPAASSACAKVYGCYALFSDPVTRLGGEKFSYQVPTYQALKGITESVYWKPTLIWIVDEARVMNAIRTEAKNIRPINYTDDGNTLSVYTYLADVCYHVRAHFIWNEHRPELAHDRDEHKHHNIARRMIERGGRRDIFLGTRECQGYVEPCDFDEGESFYQDYGALDFHNVRHSILFSLSPNCYRPVFEWKVKKTS